MRAGQLTLSMLTILILFRLSCYQVADEEDPFFLYILDVGEQDFHLLKRDQDLLVEFPVFPSKLVELIDLCIKSENGEELSQEGATDTNSVSAKTHTKFVAKLDTNTGVLSVVEMNMFKQLTHISLHLRQGNDAAIKIYLASRLKLFMSKNNNLEEQLSETAKSLNNEMESKKEAVSELTEIKSHKDVSEESLRSSHTNEIATLQMTLMNSMDAARDRYETQLESARSTIDDLHLQLKQTKEEVEESTLELKREKQHLTFRERELSRLLETAEGDRDRVFNECKEISTAKRRSEEIRNGLERDLARSGAQNESMKSQLLDREETVKKAADLQKAAEDARKMVEEKLDMYIADSENLHEKIKQGGHEITRGNSVIQRLQSDKKILTEKMKTKGDVIRKQEGIIQELKYEVASLQRSLLSEQDKTKMMSTKGDSLQDKLDESNARLGESTKIITSNQEVIAYLNEEINKWQLGLRTGTDNGADIGSGIGVTNTVIPSKWKDFTANENLDESSAAMFSPDTTKDLTYGGYYDRSSLNISNDKSDMYVKGLQNLGLADSFGNFGETDSGLENLEYYADAEVKADFNRIKYLSSNQNTSSKSYAWQAEDFGLEVDSK